MSLLLTLNSCALYQGYQPKPITEDAVARELRPKSLNFLRIQATQINHPTLRPGGIEPANPKLRAERNRRGIAEAQLIQAGILPNPSLSYSIDPVTGGVTGGTVPGYGVTASWEVTSLITR